MATRTTAGRGTQVLRAAHRSQVTELLRTGGPLSRTEVAARLGLAPSAVTAIVADLIGDGVLHELGPERTRRGRPRVLVGCDPAAAQVVAVQIGARRARVALADAAGDVLARSAVEVVRATPEEVASRVAAEAHRLAGDRSGTPVSVAGVCVPGAVDTTSGTVLRSDVLGWRDIPLAHLLGTRLGAPVLVQDVTQAATLAEARHGAASGARNAVVVDHGARIGIGLVLDGRLHRGATGLAGSIGHTPVFGDATPCRCGRRGCLEAVAGIRAMVPRAVHRRHGPDDEVGAFAEVVDRMRTGDEALTEVVHQALDRAAHAVASVVALIDPEVVVLTGLVVRFPDLADHLRARVEALVPPVHRQRLDVRTSTLGVEAWVRGAILVALQQLDPEVRGALSGAGPAGPRR